MFLSYLILSKHKRTLSEDLGLHDRTAVVMGAGERLGGAIADEGARVAVTDIDAAAAGRTAGASRSRRI